MYVNHNQINLTHEIDSSILVASYEVLYISFLCPQIFNKSATHFQAIIALLDFFRVLL